MFGEKRHGEDLKAQLDRELLVAWGKHGLQLVEDWR